jgi:hypothetical protein
MNIMTIRRRTMRQRNIMRGVVVGLALVSAFGLAAGSAWASEKFEEKFSKTEALAKEGRVTIANISGSIAVKSWAKDEVLIEATKVANASSLDKAKENAALVKIEVTKSGNILQVETKYPERSRNLNVSVNYELTIPAGASIKVRNTSGSVNANGIGGAFEGNVTSGNLTVVQVGGGVDCKVTSGRIIIQDVAGDVDIKGISGGIEVTKVKGRVDVETTSGHITLKDISGAKSVRAHLTSGRVSYDGEILAGGKYDFEAFSGGVDVTLPASAAFDLEAQSFSGHVNSDFAITMQGTVSSKEIRGVVNNGGASLRLKTFSGSINLKKK